MNSRAFRTTVSLLLSVCLLCCSVSVFADDPQQEIEEIEQITEMSNQMWLEFIYTVLKAWGINITIDELDRYTENVSNWLNSAVTQYLAETPSIGTFAQWVFPWQALISDQGILQGNESFLEDIQDFAEWLVVNFALVSNTTHVVQAGMHYLMDDNGDKYFAPPEGQLTDLATPLAHFYKHLEEEWYEESPILSFYNGALLVCFGNESEWNSRYNYWQYTLWVFRSFDGGQTWRSSSTGWGGNVTEVTTGFFYHPGDQSHEEGIYLYSRKNTGTGSYNQYQYNYNYKMDTQLSEASVVIVTGDIDIPDGGPGIVIVDGEPEYIEVVFPDSVSVNNLPAVISYDNIQNPEVDQIYTNIPAFFQTAGDTMNAFKQIIFRMPDEVLICLYALLSVGVIFGFIRIMREH